LEDRVVLDAAALVKGAEHQLLGLTRQLVNQVEVLGAGAVTEVKVTSPSVPVFGMQSALKGEWDSENDGCALCRFFES
jgi:hypothetical protein